MVRLSTTPTIRQGKLQPSPFILRVYAARTQEGWRVMPGGFCRISDQKDARALSMGEGAQASDVWVIAEKPVEKVSLLAQRDGAKVRRITGNLPSRAADNLFWLGRYLERAESTLRVVRSLCTSLMDPDAATHSAGETLDKLKGLLADCGAVEEESLGRRVTDVAQSALYDEAAYGSVVSQVRSARRARREPARAPVRRLLEAPAQPRSPAEGRDAGRHVGIRGPGAGWRRRCRACLDPVGADPGEHEPRRGWRFLDMGRRVERGVNTSRLMRKLADEDATIDDLDLLLDLIDSQITYRSRYLEGISLTPVRDLVMLDPYNPRSVAFQVVALRAHVTALPVLQDDGMPEEPARLLTRLASEVEVQDAAALDGPKARNFEHRLLDLSDAITDRYFLQGANATPTKKLGGLA